MPFRAASVQLHLVFFLSDDGHRVTGVSNGSHSPYLVKKRLSKNLTAVSAAIPPKTGRAGPFCPE
jgi:hypothetical protein